MKILAPFIIVVALVFTGCRGAGERTGRAVDHGAHKVKDGTKAGARSVGHGFHKMGEKMEDAGN